MRMSCFLFLNFSRVCYILLIWRSWFWVGSPLEAWWICTSTHLSQAEGFTRRMGKTNKLSLSSQRWRIPLAHGSSAILWLIIAPLVQRRKSFLLFLNFLKDFLYFTTLENLILRWGPLLKLDAFALVPSPMPKRPTKRKGNTSKANKFVVIEVKDSPALRLKCNLVIDW